MFDCLGDQHESAKVALRHNGTPYLSDVLHIGTQQVIKAVLLRVRVTVGRRAYVI